MASATETVRMVFHRMNDSSVDGDPEVDDVPDVVSDLDCSILTITMESHEMVWMDEDFALFIANQVKPLDKGIMLACDDDFMIELLEPKDGNTIHDFWTDLRFNTDPTFSTLLGTEFIPNTKNGFRVLIVHPAMTIGAFGLAQHLLQKANGGLTSVKIIDHLGEETLVTVPGSTT
jgi:hypothetical protein